MAWLMDTLEKVQGFEVPGSVTGKPLSLGGTPAHAGATASGVVTSVRAAFADLEIPFVGSRADLQGFGKVGGTLAFLLSSAGMRIVGISDAGGAVCNPGGVDPIALSDHVAMT